MIKFIFKYIDEMSVNESGASVSYLTAKEEFSLLPEEFQIVAKRNSCRYGYKFKITKDGINFY